MKRPPRSVLAAVAVLVALLLQVTILPHFAWHGVVPDLVLLVVVGAALATDTRFATVLGFGAGLLLDLAPPADHVAGRWTLALMVVGYVAGRLAGDNEAFGRPPYPLMIAAAAGGSFVGNSVFALTGVLLTDPSVGIGDRLGVVVSAVVYDVVAATLVVPLTVRLLTRETAPKPVRVPAR